MTKCSITFTRYGQEWPLFATIRQTAALGILPEYSLRQLEAQGSLPGVYTGRAKRINLRQLFDQLDPGGAED